MDPVRCPNCGVDLRSMLREEVFGAALGLTITEGALLQTLVEAPARVFSRAELLVSAWGWPAKTAAETSTRTVDSTITRLRRKLEAAGARADIVPVRGRGYALVPLIEAHRG